MNNNSKNNPTINPTSNFYRSAFPVKKEKGKLNFRCMKNNTISSLNEVEYFLNKLQQTIHYIKLYKLLK